MKKMKMLVNFIPFMHVYLDLRCVHVVMNMVLWLDVYIKAVR